MPRQTTSALKITRPAGRAQKSALTVLGLDTAVEVRRHPAARRLTLRVSQTRRAVIVTVPSRCRIDEASLFVHRNIDWVRARLGALPELVPFADGMQLPLRGVMHKVRFRDERGGGPIVRIEKNIAGDPTVIVRGRAEHCARRLRDWLYAQAKLDLDRCVAFHASRLGLKAKRLSLRDQASRWGSCSSTGVLSFSWRLILAPPHVLDYVAAHEVAHLAEMNHGPRFWALVRKTMPDMEKAKVWLGAYGIELHRYGATPEDAGKPDACA
jgi:predicted metal-dependent hydrolase